MEGQNPGGLSGVASRPHRLLIGVAIALLPVLVLATYVFLGSRNAAFRTGNLNTVLSLRLKDITSNNTYCGVQLLGDESYRLQVARALHLLRLSDPDSLNFVTNHIRIIIEGERSGILSWNNSPVFSLSRTSAFHSLTWCAGTIVHDANHVFIDRSFAKDHGGNPRKLGFREVQTIEKACIRRQIKTLKRIGAPRFEIDYLRSSDGTYFDVNGDGQYDWNDFHLRRW